MKIQSRFIALKQAYGHDATMQMYGSKNSGVVSFAAAAAAGSESGACFCSGLEPMAGISSEQKINLKIIGFEPTL